ncbi:hypothetical protein ACFLXQ_05075 [Chloroflexota bacterium]
MEKQERLFEMITDRYEQPEGFCCVCSLVVMTGITLKEPVVREKLYQFTIKTDEGRFFIQGNVGDNPALAQLQPGRTVTVVGRLESFLGKCGQAHSKIVIAKLYLDTPDISRQITQDISTLWQLGSLHVCRSKCHLAATNDEEVADETP